MKKIVRGNDFTLRVPVRKIVGGEAQKFPLPACEEVAVNLVNAYRRRALSFVISAEDDSLIEARVESGQLSLGSYALEVKGRLFGSAWRSNEYEQIVLVDNNAEGDTSFEPQEGEESVERQADKLATIIRLANDELLRRAQAVLSPEMEGATKDYIEKLQALTDTLAKVDEQSARLTRDSQEMENLNRTLIGINKVYDLHFASISRQVTTIEDINEQTRQLAAKIEEVNNIYARMMQQLSVMTNPMGHSAAPAANEQA